jgi:uncharacterized caspase-like protein
MARVRSFRIWGLAMVLLACCHAAWAQERNLKAGPVGASAQRVALVIGNGAYRDSPLRNPVNDARAVAARLRELGFEVIVRENLGQEQMHAAVREFGRRLERANVALFYFAGHGMQIKGRNYLIPVDAQIEHEDEVAYRSLDANEVVDKMESARTPTNLVILDACRNNPFQRQFRTRRPGLAEMDAGPGTLIAFATAPGSVASDGEGDNGVYTKHLLRQMGEAMPVEQVFKRVRVGVSLETKDQQVPWEASSLKEDFYFRPPAPGRPAVAAPEINETVLELAFWDAIKTSANPADYAAYLEQYPKGRFAALARVRMAAQKPALAAAAPPSAVAATPSPAPALASAPVPAPAAAAAAGPELTAIGFSSDGRWIATATGAGVTQIVGAANGFVLKRIALPVRPNAVSFSADGAWLAVGTTAGEVSLLDVAAGKEARRQSGHSGAVVGVAFSPDGRYLLSAGRNGEVLLRALRNWEIVKRFDLGKESLLDLQYSPDGRYFAAVQGEGAARRVKVLDVGSAREVLAADASAVSFSVNGRYVLLAAGGRAPALMELGTGRELKRFAARPARILKGSYAESGEHVTTFDAAGMAILWETKNGEKVAEIQAAREPRAVAFSPDAKVLALIDGDGQLGVYRFREGKP